MRSRRLIVRTAVVLASAALLSAKGATTKIVVTGAELDAPIELRDRELIAPFNVWSGPGTSMNGVEGADGFIVDWRAGPSEPPVGDLQRFELAFFAAAAQECLLVADLDEPELLEKLFAALAAFGAGDVEGFENRLQIFPDG